MQLFKELVYLALCRAVDTLFLDVTSVDGDFVTDVLVSALAGAA